MPKTFTCPFTQNVNSQVPQVFVNADGTSLKTCFTAGDNDSVIKAIILTSTDSSSKDIQLFISDGTSNFIIRTLNIPANSGNLASVVSVDALSGLVGLPFDEHGNKVLKLRREFEIKAGMLSAVSSNAQVNVIILGEDY